MTSRALTGGRRAPTRRLAGARVAVCLGTGVLASAAATLQLLANTHGQLPSERASARRWFQTRRPPR